MEQVYLGADVSKGYADFCLLGGDGRRLPFLERRDDTPAGHAQVRTTLAQLRAKHPTLRFTFGIEASGGLERNWLHLFRSLAGPEDQVFQLNPFVVKRFRERHLHQNVTDQSSAKDVAEYVREGRRPTERPYEPEFQGARTLYGAINNQVKRTVAIQNELHSLLPVVQPDLVQYCRHKLPIWVLAVLRRYPLAQQLARARVTTLTTLPYVTSKRAEELIAAAKESVAALTDADTALVIQTLVKELQQLKASIAKSKEVLEKRLRTDPEVRRLLTIPGVGPWTAICLRLETGSLTRFHSANALVAFAGLDPQNHQSGDMQKPGAISHRGNSALRATLYTAALCGITHNPILKPFYARLRARGKSHLTAMTACMAKLLRIAYACVVAEEDFDPAKHEVTRRKHQAQEQAPQNEPSGGEVNVAAPVSWRETKRRKMAAGAPHTAQRPHERGHAAAKTHDGTTAQERPTAAARPPSAPVPIPNPG